MKPRHCGFAMKHPYIRIGAKASFQSVKTYWYCGQCEQILYKLNDKIWEIDRMNKLENRINALEKTVFDLLEK